MPMGDKLHLTDKKVWVSGASEMVASAILRRLSQARVDIYATTRDEVDLIDPLQVKRFYEK